MQSLAEKIITGIIDNIEHPSTEEKRVRNMPLNLSSYESEIWRLARECDNYHSLQEALKEHDWADCEEVFEVSTTKKFLQPNASPRHCMLYDVLLFQGRLDDQSDRVLRKG